MKKLIIIIILYLSMVSACDKDTMKSNAEVIGFNPDKCGCCWGWTINMQWREIHTSSSIVGNVVGYDIDKPIPVYIKLGKKDESCSKHFEILTIEKID